MELRSLFKRVNPKKLNLKFEYDKKSRGRPAWIHITKGLPSNVDFIRVHLGKIGKGGRRIQAYMRYLPEGLFLPIDYTKEEMEKYYDRWSSFYDKEIKCANNLRAGDFLIKKLKKYSKEGEFLDLGSGTGLITERFVSAGFGPATLVDFSEGMLKEAKKREGLKGSKFIKSDLRKLNIRKKFNLVISTFSFGSSSYFNIEELPQILDIASKHLKEGGTIAVIGHFGEELFECRFKTLEKGIFVLDKKHKFYTDYFIGKKLNKTKNL